MNAEYFYAISVVTAAAASANLKDAKREIDEEYLFKRDSWETRI